MQNSAIPPGSAVSTDYVYKNPTKGSNLVGINSTGSGYVIQKYADLDSNVAGYACNSDSGYWYGNNTSSDVTITTA